MVQAAASGTSFQQGGAPVSQLGTGVVTVPVEVVVSSLTRQSGCRPSVLGSVSTRRLSTHG